MSKNRTIHHHKKSNSAEILCIGTELLLGEIINTNARWIAEELSTLGIDHYRQIVVGDNFSRLKKAIEDSSKSNRILITTGGLGPTQDDITHETIAATFNTQLEQIPSIWENIKLKSNNKISPNNIKQSVLPKGSKIIDNRSGTAPGIIWTPIPNFTILTFPGVPSELRQMWRETAKKWLEKNIVTNQTFISKELHFAGIKESELAYNLEGIMNNKNPTIAPYANLGQVRLRLTAKGKNKKEAEKLLIPLEEEIINKAGSNYFGTDDDTLSSIVVDLLQRKKETISVAESCTGGGIGAALTETPGASKVFSGGIIAYSNEIKENILGVPKEILEKYGAVSEEVVIRMAKNGIKTFSTDWCIAVSGLAGPKGGSKAKPIGLVYIAIANKKFCKANKFQFGSTRGRSAIQKLTVLNGLNHIRLALK